MNLGRTTTCDNAKIITTHMYDRRLMFPRRLVWLMKIGAAMAAPVAPMATTLIFRGLHRNSASTARSYPCAHTLTSVMQGMGDSRLQCIVYALDPRG